jgi:hypothetical protein
VAWCEIGQGQRVLGLEAGRGNAPCAERHAPQSAGDALQPNGLIPDRRKAASAVVFCVEVAAVLRRVPDKVRHCYARALSCRERGHLARDPVVKANWLAMEDRWLALGQRYELEECVTQFGADVRRFLGRKHTLKGPPSAGN